MDYPAFFQQATGNAPYDYQVRLACGDGPAGTPDASWLATSGPCASRLIDIPTGLGKTAAVILAWLWNRVHKASPNWPRRLIFCLPMRTLVEQTQNEATNWLKAHDLFWESDAPHKNKVGLHVLMGGENAGEWDIYPEENAILIGTQDMLLSRALNRGYGATRARWPMHFGLLNNDCLWVLDETQLMGVGVRTSAQLEGLREKIGTVLGCATWWASATLDSRLLSTPDYRTLPDSLALGPEDLQDAGVASRVGAEKRLASLPFKLTADSAKVVDPFIDLLAVAVVSAHQPATTTIVILNRVGRAMDLCAALDKLAKKQPLPPRVLVHSRFRPMEREPLSSAIRESGEKIIVATQAIEAGVDISARTLITELAPWSSLVQRFGRCNRKGEFNATGGADIFWINLEAEDEKAAAGLALPYLPAQLSAARSLLVQAEATGVSPAALKELHLEEPLPETHILRRRDLVDLFDTTPDLAGLDIDVGRYIRDGDERDVQVYWREFPKDEKLPPEEIVPQRRELVRVAIHAFRKFYEKNKSGGIWLWNVLDGEWQPVRPDRIAPGQVYLIDQALGGYSVTLGWTGEKSKEPFPVLTVDDQPARSVPRDGQDKDEESLLPPDENAWQSIETHTAHVTDALQALLAALPAASPWADALLTTVRWHDVGKAHQCFQEFIISGREVPAHLNSLFVAKAPWKPGSRHTRPHFRHELASALAWLQTGGASDIEFENLVAYLIATHHGKVRLSVRSLPGEQTPNRSLNGHANTEPLFARGVWNGDSLPADPGKSLTIAGVPTAPHELPVTLDLTCMQMGESDGKPSWTSRALSLRDRSNLGLFRLAWLETLIRSADANGSK